jgi:hypothetical protein
MPAFQICSIPIGVSIAEGVLIDSIDSYIGELESALDQATAGCNSLSAALGALGAADHVAHLDELQGAVLLEGAGLTLVKTSLYFGEAAPVVALGGVGLLTAGYVKGGLWSVRLGAKMLGQKNANQLDAPISALGSLEEVAGILSSGAAKAVPKVATPKTTFQRMPTGSKLDKAHEVLTSACTELDKARRGLKNAIQVPKEVKLPPRCESPIPGKTRSDVPNMPQRFTPAESKPLPSKDKTPGDGKVGGGKNKD